LAVRGIITLLTDFGLRDAYVGAMKGVIMGICPTAEIVDISHDVSRHDIREGAFLLSQVSPYFPEGTIHLVVIDPGVGTARRRIAVKGRRCLYVGPDNGVLFPAIKVEGVEEAVEIKEERFMLPNPSATFEGRDVFAPVAAHLAKGVNIGDLGPEIQGLVEPSFAEPNVKGGTIFGEVVHIDCFGNIVTNISRGLLEKFKVVEGIYLDCNVGGVSKVLRFCKAYGEVPVESPLIVEGSSGFIEVSVNQGSAMELFKAVVGSKVEFSIRSK
jgi:S-adenosylmethionine hydrolase